MSLPIQKSSFFRRLELGENARMALSTLRTHKTRSFLTVLGVVIGVTALIAVGSIVVGLDRDVRAFLEDYGTNTLFVFRWDIGFHVGRRTQEERMRKPLTLEDAIAIQQECPAVKNTTVEVFQRWDRRTGPVSARYKGNEVFQIDHNGTLPSWAEVYNAHLLKGRFFNDGEELHRMDVAVIGYDLQDGLFPGEDPIGKEVMVDGVSYRVVGVLDKRKGQFFRDDSADKTIQVPYTSFRKHHPTYDEHFIGVESFPGQKAAAEDEVRGLLRRRRNVPFDKPENFSVTSAEAMASQFRQIMGAIGLITVVVSSIGLLVGGVGVMNIMLMSVTERTREIGVRKAVGARRGDIIRQFLIEAVTLTGTGGAIGVLLGIGISVVINLTMPKLPSAVPAWAIVLGVGSAMSVGLFFGIYPAWKAAKLDPVEALRYE
ncbi:MAG TPA: ABC transporter permease [Terriglobales bacterium]|jgi:ABC-type antimicrobial peptide transport system permease subunit|nr:ABC transporter permease [Terriglobales bacterium]